MKNKHLQTVLSTFPDDADILIGVTHTESQTFDVYDHRIVGISFLDLERENEVDRILLSAEIQPGP